MTCRKSFISIILILSYIASMTGSLGFAYAVQPQEPSLIDGVIITGENEGKDDESSIENKPEGAETDDTDVEEHLSIIPADDLLSTDLVAESAGYDAVERLVSRLYLDVLNRTYDTAGFNDWVNRLKSGSTNGGTAAYGFFFSTEFIKEKHSDKEFVRRLYVALLDRNPEPSGEADWLDKLKSGLPRENVFAGFVNSIEFDRSCTAAGIIRGTYEPPPGGMVSVFVTRLYKTTLQRDPEADGLNDWVNRLRSGTSGATVAHGFIFSTEMENRKLNDADFVEILYEALMGRASDAKGKADWLSRMQNGISRYDVFVGFIGAPEFDRICRDHGIQRGSPPAPPINPIQLLGKIIYLDPGHGTIGSPGSAGYNEAVAMLGLARRIKPLLEARGATVVLTRDNEINVPIAARCAMINIHTLEAVRAKRTNASEINEINRLIDIMKGVLANPREEGPIYMNLDPFDRTREIHPDLSAIFKFQNDPVVRDDFLVISLHSNAVGSGSSSSARGAEVYYISPAEVANTRHYYPDYSFTSQSRKFANILLDHIQVAGIPRRTYGLRPENYAMIREINVPAVLTENGFHTNPADRALLSDPGFMDRLATEYLNAIVRYFS